MYCIVFGYYRRETGYYLQLKIDNEKKTVTRGYCLARYTDIKVNSRRQLDRIQENYTAAGYTLIND